MFIQLLKKKTNIESVLKFYLDAVDLEQKMENGVNFVRLRWT